MRAGYKFLKNLAGQKKLFASLEEERAWGVFLRVSHGRLSGLFRYIHGVTSYLVGGHGEILLNNHQSRVVRKLIAGIGWNIAFYFPQISFVSYFELREFLRFAYEVKLSRRMLSQVLASKTSLCVTQLHRELLQKLLVDVVPLATEKEDAVGQLVAELLEESDWSSDTLFKFISGSTNASEFDSKIQVLHLLHNYGSKINPETIDRRGRTARELLAWRPREVIPTLLRRLIEDNSYYVAMGIETIFEELGLRNPTIPRAKLAYLFNQFTLTYNKMLVFREDWYCGHSDIEIGMNGLIEQGYLYFHKQNVPVCLATVDKKVCRKSGNKAEDGNANRTELWNLAENLGESRKIIHDQAMQWNLVPRPRGIAKPLTLWHGSDGKCLLRCEHFVGDEKDSWQYEIYRSRCNEKNDFLRWFQSYSSERKETREIGKLTIAANWAEIFAVISQAIFEIKGFYPRMVQLLALFLSQEIGDNVVVQVATGEGKTLVFFMQAVIKALEGEVVNFVTSSHELATRDAMELKQLYNLFGLTVGHNIAHGQSQSAGNPYGYDILYGTVASFIADLLRDDGARVCRERAFNYVMVDELDSMFFDRDNISVQLAHGTPGFEVFRRFFGYLHGTLRNLAAMVEDRSGLVPENKEGGCYFKRDLFNKALTEDTPERELVASLAVLLRSRNKEDEILGEAELVKLRLGDNCHSFMEEYMQDYGRRILGLNQLREDRLINLPPYLETFAESQMNNWVGSLLLSLGLKSRVHYVIRRHGDAVDEVDGHGTLEIVDNQHTGTIMHDLHWEDGLHQFLQLTNGLVVTAESIVSIFKSQGSFFRSHGGIYGLTGTIGDEAHRRFLKHVYGMEAIIMPPFATRDLVKFPTAFVASREQWHEKIMESTYANSYHNLRATLIVMESIREVDELAKLLRQRHTNLAIATYGLGDREENTAIKKLLRSGDVIVATTLGGRGMDLKIDASVKSNGGLHVILTFFPRSMRVEEQVFGRAARRGEPGSSQLIINLRYLETECVEKQRCLQEQCDGQGRFALEKCLGVERNEKNKRDLLYDELIRAPAMLLRDELYLGFLVLQREFASPSGYKLLVKKNCDEMEDLTLNLYGWRDKLKLRIVDQQKVPAIVTVDITSAVNSIYPAMARRLLSVLRRSDVSAANLSYGEFMVVHFIAVIFGYGRSPEIYEQILHDFNASLEKESMRNRARNYGGGKSGYLRWFLYHDPNYADLCQTVVAEEGIILARVELRRKFFLWEKMVELSSKKARGSQVRENFGLWLKQQQELPSYDRKQFGFNLEKGQAKVVMDNFAMELRQNFTAFREEIVTRDMNDTLVRNPAYLVNDAWRGLWLLRDGRMDRDGCDSKRCNEFYDGALGALWNQFFSLETEEQKMPSEVVIHSAVHRISWDKKNFRSATLLDDGITYCEQALALDATNFGAWAAHGAKATLITVRAANEINHVRQRTEAINAIRAAIGEFQEAIRAIETINLPHLEAQLLFALKHGLSPDSEEMKKQSLTIAMYERIVEIYNENISIALAAANHARGKLDIDCSLALEEVIDGLNVTAIVHRWLNVTKGSTGIGTLFKEVNRMDHSEQIYVDRKTQKMIIEEIEQYGGYLFKMHVGLLQEKRRKWWGTFCTTILGVVSMATGIGLMALGGGGVFFSVFGASLVSNGISDILSSTMAVLKKTPVDFGKYISSKGFSLAIAALSAGTLFLVQKVTEYYQHSSKLAKAINGRIKSRVKKLEKLSCDHRKKWVFDTFRRDLASRGISRITMALGDRMLRDGDKIAVSARRAIEDIIRKHGDILARLGATKEGLLEKFYEEVDSIIDNHRSHWSTSIQAAMEIGTNALDMVTGGWGSYANVLTRTLVDSMKNRKILDNIVRDVEAAIYGRGALALSGNALFEREFVAEVGGDGKGVARELKLLKITIDGHYNCTKMATVKFHGHYASYQVGDGIVEICRRVQQRLINFGNFKELRERFVAGIVKAKGDIQKSMLQRGANFAGNQWSASLIKSLDDRIDDIIYHMRKKAVTDFAPRGSEEVTVYETKEPDECQGKANDGATEPKTTVAKNQYITQPGDTLLGIAAMRSKIVERPVSVDELLQLNPTIGDRNLIFPGISLVVPAREDELISKFETRPIVVQLFRELLDSPLQWHELAFQGNYNFGGTCAIDGRLMCWDGTNTYLPKSSKPTIELVIRNVFGEETISEIKFLNFKHGFTVFTFSDGRRIIIAGYPERHNFLRNLQIVELPYVEENSGIIGRDWIEKNQLGNRYKVIYQKEFSSDEELEGYLAKARVAVKRMETGNEGKRYDYDLCLTKRCWGENSNTVQREIYQAMDLDIDESVRDENMPGIDGKFYCGPMDDIVKELGIKVLEAMQDPQQLPI